MIFCVKNAQILKCVTDKQTNQLTQWVIETAGNDLKLVLNIIIYLIPCFSVLKMLKNANA